MKLFVGSLPFDITEDQLHQMFTPFGAVAKAQLISDRDTGRSKGFGFVEMPNDTEGQAAMTALNGSTVGTRQIVVNVARPMEARRPGGPGGHRHGGHGGGFKKQGFRRW
jgi:RNA recognition motif-containing protein